MPSGPASVSVSSELRHEASRSRGVLRLYMNDILGHRTIVGIQDGVLNYTHRSGSDNIWLKYPGM